MPKDDEPTAELAEDPAAILADVARSGAHFDLSTAVQFTAALEQHFARTKRPEYLDAATALLQAVLRNTPASHYNYSAVVHLLGLSLQNRFSYSREPGDLDAAIGYLREAVDVAADHPNLPLYLLRLQIALELRFDLAGTVEDLDEGVSRTRQAVACAPETSPLYLHVLIKLGLALASRHEKAARPDDIDEAAEWCKKAVWFAEATGQLNEDVLLPAFVTLRTRFEFRRDGDDLTFAITYCQRGRPRSAAEAAEIAGHLCVLYRMRYEYADVPGDLDSAIRHGKFAASNTPSEDPDLPMRLAALSGAMSLRSYWAGHDADLDDAIAVAKLAASAIAPHDPQRGAVLADGGTFVLLRYERRGDINDLEFAVAQLRAARMAPSPTLHERLSTSINYARALEMRFLETGDTADINAAIDELAQLLEIVPAGHLDQRVILDKLGVGLSRRFAYTDNMLDLNMAIRYLSMSVGHDPHTSSAPDADIDRGYRLSHLAEALLARSRRTNSAADLNRAIELFRRAAQNMPEREPVGANIMTNLGQALMDRCQMMSAGDAGEHSGQVLPQLDEAIRLISVVPVGQPRLGGAQSGYLGLALAHRFDITGHISDADASIEAYERAIESESPDDPTRLEHLVNLASVLVERARLTEPEANRNRATEALREALRISTASPYRRALAAMYLGGRLSAISEWAGAGEAYETAISLLTEAAPAYLARADQEHRLEAFANLPCDAAACFINAGDVHRAVTAIEAGRSVLLSQALDLRLKLDERLTGNSELAARYTSIMDQVWSAETARLNISDTLVYDAGVGGDVGSEAELARIIDRCQRLARERGALVAEIRQAGIDNFLRPMSAADLLKEGSQGPVVILNASRYRCDAIVIGTSGAEVVSWPGLSYNDVVAQANGFYAALSRAFEKPGKPDKGTSPIGQSTEEALAVLGWLWTKVVQPVVASLPGSSPAPAIGSLPRVWWIPSGPFSFLPVHAAGIYDPQSGQARVCLGDTAISSYSPSVRVLAECRRRTGHAERQSTLIVALPDTGGPDSLRWADAEARLIGEVAGDTVRLATGLTRERVLAELAQHSRAHFACHAASLRFSPSEAALVLGGPEAEQLSVRDLSRLRLEEAELAVLSACQTGRPGLTLTDEAIHLSSAFQLAGYRHVISTLWPIDDREGLELMGEFYRQLAKERDNLDVASVLHATCRKLRSRYPSRPWMWTAHIHSGP